MCECQGSAKPKSLNRPIQFWRQIATIICLSSGLSGCGGSVSQPASNGVTSEVVVVDSPRELKGPLPNFRMLGPESGFDFERYDDITGQRRLIEANGGGVAVFDFDRDGWIDVFMTNGCKLPLSLNDRGTPSELFRNRSEMQFKRAAESAVLRQFGYATGGAVGDYDSDGFDDLYVTAFGRNSFWRNYGDGTFADVTEETGTAVPQWSTSTTFADLNRDGHLDLYVVNYVDESDENPKRCPNLKSPDGFEQCPPALFQGVDDVILLSDGAGCFLDVTQKCKIAGLRGKGLGVVVSDLDQDLFADIYVANDGEANSLFVISDASRSYRASLNESELWIPEYEDRAAAAGVALNEAGFAQASMGIALGDVDRNGWDELFVTNFFGDTNTLYANRGKMTFDDITRASGLGAPSRNRLGFGTMFFDANNDGWLDAIVANGHVDDREWLDRGEPYRMRPLLHLNQRDGTFADVTRSAGEYFQREWLGRGLAIADLDRDGRLDVIVSHEMTGAAILKNETQTRDAAVRIRLVGDGSGRSGFGSRIDVIGSTPICSSDFGLKGSFQSAHSPVGHFNCRIEGGIQAKIRWPNGTVVETGRIGPGDWVVHESQPECAHLVP